MASVQYYELLLGHLKASRQGFVDELMRETPPTPGQFRELADLQQAITAVEAVIAEDAAASGGMPLRRT
jgi:hypothetical protein